MQFSIRRIRKKAGAKERGIVDVADELARKGTWLTLVSQPTGQGKRVRLYYQPKPLLILFSSLAIAGYLAAAVALTWWLGRMPFNRVSFFDVALPWRWSGMNALRGDGFSARGLKELSDEQFQRVGLTAEQPGGADGLGLVLCQGKLLRWGESHGEAAIQVWVFL